MISNFDFIEALRTSPIMWVLVGFSVLTLGIALERLYYYWKRQGQPDRTLEQALRKIRSGDLREAGRLLCACPHPMGAVSTQLLEGEYIEGEKAEEQLQIALSEQRMLLERNLGFLGTMAAVAPLVGLLGTVWGIMRAFHDMSTTGSAAPSVVAAGVAEALLTTAVGLIIAVPALMLYNHFARRMNVMLTVAENDARSIRGALAAAPDRRTVSRDAREAGLPHRPIEQDESRRAADEPETVGAK
jgi:biopolymer transport protein ExbB